MAGARARSKADAGSKSKTKSKSADAEKTKRGARSGERGAAARDAPSVTEENRLRRDTAFLCHVQFKNDLPPVPVDWKMLATRVDRGALAEYSPLSLYDGMRRRGDFSEDLGIPIDPALMRAYRVPTERGVLDPEDHELLLNAAERETKRNTANGASGRAASRPDASDALWLMNTQYISAGKIKARTGLSEKEMKRRKLAASGAEGMPEDELSFEEQVDATFEAAKKPPVHPTMNDMEVVEILPVFPDFERMALEYVRLNFDENQAKDVPSLTGKSTEIVESALINGVVKPFAIENDYGETERFLSLMLPQDPEAAAAPNFLEVDGEPRAYDHIRDYVYKLQRDDPAQGGGNVCFFFKKDKVTFVDLQTKLTLSKRSKHSKGKDALDWKPSRVTLKRRSMTEEERASLEEKRAKLRAT
ncbi:RNA polymerase II-associated [Ostreococcus tauri]|uniref:RNA polymerase II-associated n=1 Tax=Ostreococcus tauri TaxID=70448 RepID=A0A1Y5I628_OSTTA|nr:RNA polymerase II-associated [Ostreococcus tauri]